MGAGRFKSFSNKGLYEVRPHLVNENVSLQLKGNSVFCLTCSPSPEFRFSYFLGNLPRLCERKTKSFRYWAGESWISRGRRFAVRLPLLQMPRYSVLNHIYLFFTVNSSFVLKSRLAALGVFICSHFIFQVKAFLLKIQLSRLLIVGMTVTLLCGFCFFF